MKLNRKIVHSAFTLLLLAGAGCSTLPKSDVEALQGTWKGQEIGKQADGSCLLIVSGKTMEFRGADTREWYKAEFTVKEDINPHQVVAVINECPFPQYVGKTTHAIYRLEAGMLTFAGNEPGNPEVPTGFDAPGSRQFVLKRN